MSQQRRCDVTKCNDGKWYMVLGNHEYAEEDHDCTTYGPFASEDAVDAELENHSNPGGQTVDDSGTADPPDPATLTKPTQRFRRSGW